MPRANRVVTPPMETTQTGQRSVLPRRSSPTRRQRLSAVPPGAFSCQGSGKQACVGLQSQLRTSQRSVGVRGHFAVSVTARSCDRACRPPNTRPSASTNCARTEWVSRRWIRLGGWRVLRCKLFCELDMIGEHGRDRSVDDHPERCADSDEHCHQHHAEHRHRRNGDPSAQRCTARRPSSWMSSLRHW